MVQTVYIVRHGNTFNKGDTVTRVGARTDLPLSSSGRLQAAALAEHFSSHKVLFGAAFSSPLLRTTQTAKAIIAAQPGHLEVAALEFLREIDYGKDENKPEAEVVARIGQEAIDLWDTEAILPDGWQVDIAALCEAWKGLFAQIVESGSSKPTLVVTSNGIARFALKLAATGAGNHELKLKTGAFGVMQLSTDTPPVILDWNCRPET